MIRIYYLVGILCLAGIFYLARFFHLAVTRTTLLVFRILYSNNPVGIRNSILTNTRTTLPAVETLCAIGLAISGVGNIPLPMVETSLTFAGGCIRKGSVLWTMDYVSLSTNVFLAESTFAR